MKIKIKLITQFKREANLIFRQRTRRSGKSISNFFVALSFFLSLCSKRSQTWCNFFSLPDLNNCSIFSHWYILYECESIYSKSLRKQTLLGRFTYITKQLHKSTLLNATLWNQNVVVVNARKCMFKIIAFLRCFCSLFFFNFFFCFIFNGIINKQF